MARAQAPGEPRSVVRTIMVVMGLLAFCAAFVIVDQGFDRLVRARFPPMGASASLATLYGVVSRLHLIVPLLVLALWGPRSLGFQLGRTRHHWRLLLLVLVANCGIVGAYLLWSGSGTPYSGGQWLLTEVVVVPLVEETIWRGAVFAVLLSAFRRIYSDGRATTVGQADLPSACSTRPTYSSGCHCTLSAYRF